MAKPPRDHTSFGSRTHFITAKSWAGRSIFQSERSASLLIETLLDYRAAGKYELHEFVVMPDHTHLLLTPALDLTLERVMQFVKGGFSHRAGQRLGPSLGIWARGYVDHRIRDMQDYESHRDYIHQNPVRRGLATLPEDFPYSSANPRFRLDPIPQGLKPAAEEALMRHD
ncbi:MAG: REP-associated tyrosine transposase [Terriglobales bacterium]